MENLIKGFLVYLSLTLLPGILLGQGNLGTITGTVRDSTGAVIPAAKIKITETQTNVVTNAVTTSVGYYRTFVPPGTYQISASKAGFKTGIYSRVLVDPAQTIGVNFTLEVGATRQTLVVSGKPPMLNTSTAQVGTTISTHVIDSLPTGAADGGRDPENFIFSSLPGNIGGPYNGSVGGGLRFSDDVTVDGISVSDYQRQGGTLGLYRPGFDAFSEVTVQQSSYSAQYGNSGGSVVNYQMKSGTNQFHGDLFDFWNNNDLQANGFDFNAIPGPKQPPHFNDNDFGVALGGPIILPHIYDGRNRSFFYFTYEGDRYTDYNFGGFTTLPTMQMLQGDFSQLLGQQIGTDALGRPVYANEIYNPTTTRNVTQGQVDPVTGLTAKATATIRDPFSYNGLLNVIPPQYFSTASKKILPLFPAPMLSTLYNNEPTYTGTWPEESMNLFSIKGDHIINDQHRLSAFLDRNAHGNPVRFGGPSFPPLTQPLVPVGAWNFNSWIARLSEDWSISSDKLNHFGIGYNRMADVGLVQAPTQLVPSALGITGPYTDNTFPQIVFSGHNPFDGTFGNPSAELDVTESYIVTDNFSYIHGRHSFDFGGVYTRYHYNNAETPPSLAASFNDLETSLPGFQTQTGHQFASFVLGAVDSGNYIVQATNPGYRQSEISLWAQDTWKMTHKLTLDLGLRWDIPTPRKEAFNRMSEFDFSLPNPGANGYPGAYIFAGNCTGCTGRDSFQDMYWKEFGPHVGLAYNPIKNLVIRTGYGIVYMPPIMEGTGHQVNLGYNSALSLPQSAEPTPFSVDPVTYWSSLSGASIPSYYSGTGFPSFTHTLPYVSPIAGNGQGVDYLPSISLRGPYVQEWNFGIQYELPANVLLEVDYLGNKGTLLSNGGMANLIDQVPDKYMGLGDILGMNFAQALANPATAATLATYGVTQLPYPSFRGQVRQGLRPFPQVTQIRNDLPYFGYSTYNTLQMTATKRVGQGLSFIASYNWSKALGNTSSMMAVPGYNVRPADFYNQKAMKAPLAFNYPQYFKLTWVYQLPFGAGRHWLGSSKGLVQRLVGGWTLAAIQGYHSGDALSITTNIRNGLFAGMIYPDAVLGVSEKVPFQGPLNLTTGNQYLNPAAFKNVPTSPINRLALRFGNLSPVLPNVRGPSRASESASLMKDVALNERVKLRLRVDVFNLFNRTGLGDPVTNFSSPLFGKITNVAYGPRGMQLAAYLSW